MRIVFVINSLIYGGAETQVIATSKTLVARGHAVCIYTLNQSNPRIKELADSGVEVVIDEKRKKLDLTLIMRIQKHIRCFRADIVHGFLFDGNIYAAIAARLASIPVLASERNDNYALNLNQRVSLFFLRYLVSGIVANSKAGARFANKLFRLPAENVHVVWNGINSCAIESKSFSCKANFRRDFFGVTDCKIACMVGIVKRAKDYNLALQVGDLLTSTHPGWKVLLVGGPARDEPAYFDEVVQTWRELRLEGRVHMTGLRQDIAEIMGQCDVVFSTSHHEGFPNVVLEAMTLRKPVVSTEYSDIKLILPESWQVVESRCPVDICRAILKADSEQVSVAKKQIDWVIANATIEVAAKRLEEIYRTYEH